MEPLSYLGSDFTYERCPYKKDGIHTVEEKPIFLGGGYKLTCGECGSRLGREYFHFTKPPKPIPTAPPPVRYVETYHVEEPTFTGGCCFGT